MNIAIDIGNTQIKVGWFEGAALVEQHRLAEEQEILSMLPPARTVTAVMLSSVAGNPVPAPPVAGSLENDIATNTPLSTWLQQLSAPIIALDGHTPLPFVNTYLTPATLGTDRIAAVAGAHQIYPQQTTLVVDVGTCITYDVLDSEAYYRGGVISPGLQMRLRAMHTFTARLPLVELNTSDEPKTATVPDITERSTSDGLRSGALWGMAAEISQMIRMYADKFSDLRVVLCGGDAPYLLTFIHQNPPVSESPIAVVPELILIGLNCILQHNVNQEN